jgi:cytochrome c-type biogenesis protein CcmH
MYWWLGAPAAIDPVAAQKASNDQVATMVDALAARLKANPDNPKGWAMLARSYKVMGKLAEAEAAFLKAGDLVNNEPDLLVDYADLLAVRANNNIEGKPLELVNKALGMNPQHPMGLMMSGVAAYRRNDFKLAVAQWEKLLLVLDPGSPDAQQVEADIAEARAKAGLPAAARAAPGAAAGASSDAGKLPAVAPEAAGAMTPEKINQMIDTLAARLKTNPDDLAGWVRLARAYKVQGRLPEAEEAFGKAGKLVDADPDLLTQYADLIAMRTNSLEGRPLALINKALALNPQHPTALMLAGSAAYRRADYKQAIALWEKVLKVLPPGSGDAVQVEAEIADARTKAGLGLR